MNREVFEQSFQSGLNSSLEKLAKKKKGDENVKSNYLGTAALGGTAGTVGGGVLGAALRPSSKITKGLSKGVSKIPVVGPIASGLGGLASAAGASVVPAIKGGVLGTGAGLTAAGLSHSSKKKKAREDYNKSVKGVLSKIWSGE